MRITLENKIWESINDFCIERDITNIWKKPIVKFADDNNSLFYKLKEVFLESHYTPKEYLEDATIVISYFIPFIKEIGQSNVDNSHCSKEWGQAYINTNDMAKEINESLVEFLKNQVVEALG